MLPAVEGLASLEVRALAIAGIVVVMLAAAAPAFADRAMSTRFSTNDNGNITFAANTLMVCPAAAAGCTAARNTSPVATGTNNALNNNTYNMQYVNTAPGAVAGVASFDSSSSDLQLPSTATVLFAGLYWGAGYERRLESERCRSAPTPGCERTRSVSASQGPGA